MGHREECEHRLAALTRDYYAGNLTDDQYRQQYEAIRRAYGYA